MNMNEQVEMEKQTNVKGDRMKSENRTRRK